MEWPSSGMAYWVENWMFNLSCKTNNFHKFLYLHAVIPKPDYQNRTWSAPKISTPFYLFLYVFKNTDNLEFILSAKYCHEWFSFKYAWEVGLSICLQGDCEVGKNTDYSCGPFITSSPASWERGQMMSLECSVHVIGLTHSLILAQLVLPQE